MNPDRRFKDSIYEQFARIGKAVSSPKRLELLDLLCQGKRTVEVLARETGMSVANTSQHLQVLRAARLVAEKGCVACHMVKGNGGYVGPNLTQVGERLRPGWAFKWLLNPRRLKPDSIMPVFGFSDEEALAITAFLMRQRAVEPEASAIGGDQ